MVKISMYNVLVTGSKGQVGSEISYLVSNNPSSYDKYKFFFTDRSSLDICDKQAITKFVDVNNIHTIINCAAYTAVDKAESDEISADRINHLAVRYLAKISKEKNIRLVHISTDYVFDGMNYKPYVESDSTNPQSVYGKTKLSGEEAIVEINPKDSIIIRTSWVYSTFGANFVKTMLRLGSERPSLGVVYDQIGSPTYARDLASAILTIVDSESKNSDTSFYNYSNEGVVSWYDFAKEIMKMAKLQCEISSIETSEYPTPAKRPHFSVLNKAKIKRDYNIVVPYWKDSLRDCLIEMGARK